MARHFIAQLALRLSIMLLKKGHRFINIFFATKGVDWQSQKLLPPYFVIKYTAMKVRVVHSTRFLLRRGTFNHNFRVSH